MDNVDRGVAWLDEVRPGWWEMIDTENFAMSDPCLCVAGYVFAADVPEDEAGGEITNGFDAAWYILDGPEGVITHGFSTHDLQTYDGLRTRWLEEIDRKINA